MTSVTALFNQKHSLNVICVFYFHFIRSRLVSASDVTPTERWLNVWCIWLGLQRFVDVIDYFDYKKYVD